MITASVFSRLSHYQFDVDVLQFDWVCPLCAFCRFLLILLKSFYESWHKGQAFTHPNIGNVPNIRDHAAPSTPSFAWGHTRIQAALSLQPFCRSGSRKGKLQNNRDAPQIRRHHGMGCREQCVSKFFARQLSLCVHRSHFKYLTFTQI
jgi:hypothetical protein